MIVPYNCVFINLCYPFSNIYPSSFRMYSPVFSSYHLQYFAVNFSILHRLFFCIQFLHFFHHTINYLSEIKKFAAYRCIMCWLCWSYNHSFSYPMEIYVIFMRKTHVLHYVVNQLHTDCVIRDIRNAVYR